MKCDMRTVECGVSSEDCEVWIVMREVCFEAGSVLCGECVECRVEGVKG